MREEKERGITYVVLAGAAPSLVPDLLGVCYQEMPLGSIASNGFKFIPKSVNYRIHVSVWAIRYQLSNTPSARAVRQAD